MTTEQLKALELTDDQIKGVMKLKGEAITAALQPVEQERDGYKGQLETANIKIQGFAGIDVEKLNTEITKWKGEYETAKAAAETAEYMRHVESYASTVPLKSALARKAFVADLAAKKLAIENGKLLGADDYVKALRESDPDAFASDQQQQARGGAGFGDKNPPRSEKNGNDFMNSLIRGEVSQEGV